MKISKEDAQAALDAFMRAGTKKDAALDLGIGEASVRRRLKAAEQLGLTSSEKPAKSEKPVADQLEDNATILRLRARNKQLEAQLKEIQKDNLTAQDMRKFVLGLATETPEPPNWLVKTGAKSTSGVTGVPSTIWSDWHLGERVDKAQVNGINECDLQIAEARIRRLVGRTIDLCRNHMTNPTYPGIVVNLIGDIVSGIIHPELAETNDLELNPTILWAVNIITWALQRMADAFDKVFVACAPGNHGREWDRKPRAKNYVFRNADWLVYCLVEMRLRDLGDRRIQLSIPDTGEALYRVYHHRYMAVHGDDLGVRGGDGIIGAIGPIMRGEIKVRHSQAEIGRDYDTLLMGHWHQTLWLQRAIVNNCLKGYDEYARRMLRAVPAPPSQALWFNHPKHGITARWEVFLEGREMASDAAWVSWSEDDPAPWRAAA